MLTSSVVQERMKAHTKAWLGWFALALCGGVLACAGLMFPLSNVHTVSRNRKRLADIQNADGESHPTQEEYVAACGDVIHVAEQTVRLGSLNFYVGGAIVVVAIIGSSRLKKRKEQTAQHQAGGYR